MGLFGKGKGGGLMNVIRCDEQEYLVWKWRPDGQDVNSTSRENSIRFGSSLRVKDGEVAVFVYKQPNGETQDFILGPFDGTIKTANFPVLASIVGAAFGGESPFQAEVYFINLAGNIQIRFGIPYFDVADPRFLDYIVPVSAGGTITFHIADFRNFIKLNRLINFDLAHFELQIKDAVINRVKSVIANAPSQGGIPLVQIERRISEIQDEIINRLKVDFEDFGVCLKRLDISRIEPDKESEGWIELRKVTAGQQTRTIEAQTSVNIKNLEDAQRINAENMEDTLRIQREQAEMAQRLQTETKFMGAHALDQQTSVLKTGAQSLGSMGVIGGEGGGMNPAGLMTGMMIGGAMGGQLGNMMNQMGGAINGQYASQVASPPDIPQTSYYLAINGQQAGPFVIHQLQQLVISGQLTKETLVWRQGMAAWTAAYTVNDLKSLFDHQTPPPIPNSIPPIPQP